MTKNDNIKISIVVPVYNVESSLGCCLDSLLNQDLPDNEYEIILIDDGSSDNSFEICNTYASKRKHISVYSQENGGASVARNRGLEAANGEYIFFVDSDDYIAENVLKGLYDKALKNECDILFFNYSVVAANSDECFRVFPNIERDAIFNGEHLICNTKDFGSLWKGIYKREFIDNNRVRFTEGIIHQDTDFNMKAYPFAERLMIVDKNVYFYRYIGESATRTQSISKRQLILYSDFVVCSDIKSLINFGKLSDKVADVYEKHANSILVGATIQLIKTRKLFGKEFVNKCLRYSFENKLYPIKGKTSSWKTGIVAKMLNCYLILLD